MQRVPLQRAGNPPMSVAMIIFVVTIAVSLAGLYLKPKIVEGNVFRPYRVARGRDVHTALTSGFVHADMMHLLFNMMTFWFFAFALERTIGPVRFDVAWPLTDARETDENTQYILSIGQAF